MNYTFIKFNFTRKVVHITKDVRYLRSDSIANELRHDAMSDTIRVWTEDATEGLKKAFRELGYNICECEKS